MLGIRLVRLIEKHSTEIANTVVKKIQNSERTTEFRKLSEDELRHAVEIFYGHLGDWLLSRSENDIELQFKELGLHRAAQGIPASQTTWAMFLAKEHIWSFLQREAVADRALELYGELEFLQALDLFHDRAVYYVLIGHEQARLAKAA